MSAVPKIDLSGKRVLLLGAETETGGAIAAALAEAGAQLALVATTTDAQAAFAVQRLARRLSVAGGNVRAQAIGATNEMAMRVMVRQVAKQLGGLEAVVFCAVAGEQETGALDLAIRLGGKEMARSGGGVILVVDAPSGIQIPEPPPGAFVLSLPASSRRSRRKAQEVVLTLAAMPRNK